MPRKDIQKAREYSHEYYLKNRERLNTKRTEQREHFREIDRKWYKEHPERWTDWNSTQRLKVFEHYGMSCACCGESHFEFLTIDHINGNGIKHRKAIGGHFYYWLVKNNFPPEFQTLCYNCNCAKGRYGFCPHAAESK